MPYSNPFEGQSPIFGPMARALQTYSMIQQLKNDALDRQRQLEQEQYNRQRQSRIDAQNTERFNYQKERDRYGQANDTLQTRLNLLGAGAKVGNPKAEEALTGLLGAPTDARPSVTAPSGETYYLPTQKEQQQNALDAAIELGKRKSQELEQTEKVRAKFSRENDLFKHLLGIQYPTPSNARPPANRVIQTEKGGIILDQSGKTIGVNPDLVKAQPKGAEHPAKSSIDKIESIKANAQAFLKEAQIWGTSQDKNAPEKRLLALAKAKAAEDEAISLAANLKRTYPKNFSYQVDRDNNISVDWKD